MIRLALVLAVVSGFGAQSVSALEQRDLFQCKERFLDMAKEMGFKKPAMLYRTLDNTLISAYENFKPQVSLMSPKPTGASFLIYDSEKIKESELKGYLQSEGFRTLQKLREKKVERREIENELRNHPQNGDARKDLHRVNGEVDKLEETVRESTTKRPVFMVATDAKNGTELMLEGEKSDATVLLGKECQVAKLDKPYVQNCVSDKSKRSDVCLQIVSLIAYNKKAKSGRYSDPVKIEPYGRDTNSRQLGPVTPVQRQN